MRLGNSGRDFRESCMDKYTDGYDKITICQGIKKPKESS